MIRFNLDSILRADFKSRQEGLQIQRRNGVISANEWREIEGKNPLKDAQGNYDPAVILDFDYWALAPR